MNVQDTKKRSHTKWKRLRAMKEGEIDFSDIPSLGPHFFKRAKLRLPGPKPIVTIRLDRDVLEWFKRQGKGYQTRINAVLRIYMDGVSRRSEV